MKLFLNSKINYLVKIYGFLIIFFIKFLKIDGNENFLETKFRWKKADVLIVIDSTENIGYQNHRLLNDFFYQIFTKIEHFDDEIYVSAAQFTPEERIEFDLQILNDHVENEIKVGVKVVGRIRIFWAAQIRKFRQTNRKV